MIKTIPYDFKIEGIAPESLDLQKRQFKKHRDTCLFVLRNALQVKECIKGLEPDTVYKLVCSPEGGKLFKDSSGNFKGVFYKDGKIIEHAKFEKIDSSFFKASKAIGTQIVLMSIVMQLEDIKKSMNRVFKEFHNDRVAEIHSGRKLFKQAMSVHDLDKQSRLIENSIQTINTGIEKTLLSLKLQIEEAPDASNGLFDNWGKSKHMVAEEKMSLAEESLCSILTGIKTIAECYSAIDEPHAAGLALNEALSELFKCGGEKAIQKARLMQMKGSTPPEAPWQKLVDHESTLKGTIETIKNLEYQPEEGFEIELKPSELLGGKT